MIDSASNADQSAEPGASQSTLRAALRGTRNVDIDHAVRQLVRQGLVEDKRKGPAHAYYLTDAGRAQVTTEQPEGDV